VEFEYYNTHNFVRKSIFGNSIEMGMPDGGQQNLKHVGRSMFIINNNEEALPDISNQKQT